MSNDICIWKSNKHFRKEDAPSLYGQLVESKNKPDKIDTCRNIEKFVQSITTIYPSLENEPSSVWASSFICSEWHCTVSMSYSHPSYVDAIIDMQSLCEKYGLTFFDSNSGDVFPE